MEVENLMAASASYAPKKIEAPVRTTKPAENKNAGAANHTGEANVTKSVPVVPNINEKGNGDNGNDSNPKQQEKPVLDMPSENTIRKATDDVNKKIEPTNRRLDLSIHEKTQRLLVKVVDADTDKVIREIPAEETLDFLAKVLEQAGVLVDKKG